MRSRIGLLGAAVFGLFVPVFAHATLTVTPITWNVVGLDSNSPTSGPKDFPVGARVCSNVATINVGVNWNWDSANANVNLRPGSLSTVTLPAIGAGVCADAYFEIEVNQVAAAYDTTRRYHITATDGSGTVSSLTPREVYVEHLISQNRNSITGVKLNGVSIPAGGSMNLVVGNTYTIELDGGTATQGYNQFEAFISFPNTIFQILSVSTTYSADNSPYVPGPAPIASDKLYADACLWENDPTSPNYRSCIGGDYKAGGSTVVTTYTVKVISGGGTAQTLNSLLYDFSGSSYHYNSDFGVNAVVANIVDPAALTISKEFSPTPTVAGGTSTLTFTIGNPNPSAVSGASFTDPLPALSGNQMVVATPATFSTSGCGSPTFAPTAGASSISFSNGSVAANSTCVVSVLVSVPSTPTSGTYANTSNELFVGGVDSGHFASASLPLTSSSAGSGLCGLTLAQWTMAPAAGTTVPPAYSFKASNVTTATAAAGSGITSTINTTIGNPVNSWSANGFSTAASLTTSNDDYFEFVATTTNYTSIGFNFDARLDTNLHGPQSLHLYSSTDGSTFTAYGSTISPTATFTTYNPAFGGTANTNGLTYFRIYGYNAGNNGADALLLLDNISITGCGTPVQPALTKAFSPNPIAVNDTSTLTFTLTNTNTVQLTGAKFTDSLPGGLQVAASPAASTTCTGSPTWAPAAGSTAVNFGQTTGANIPASGSCTASVNVTATTAGPHTNVSGFISTTEGGTNSGASGSATASLSAIVAPSIAKAFGTDPILTDGTSLLTFTITNPNASDMLTGIAFADTYPGGLVNVSPLSPPVANTCAGSVTATAGGNSISLSGGSLAGGASCTVSVTVTAAAANVYANTSGTVSATTAGTGNTASASLTVNSPHPAISVLKRVGTSATGPWFDFLSVAPTTPLYYEFTAENTGDVALNPFSVSDPTLAGTGADPAGCVWQTTNSPSTLPALPVATATIDPTATCVVGPISAANGDHPNTATAHGTYSGTVYNSSPASADYIGATPGFSLLKQIGTSASGPWSSAINVSAGDDVFYKFTLVNTGALVLSSISVTDPLVSTASCTFTDPLPVNGATTCMVGPVVASGAGGSTTTNTATGNGSNSGTIYHTAPSSASYTIGAATADLAVTKDDGTASVNAGGSTIYTIVATNNGPSAVIGATVTDTAPAGLTIGAWTCAASAGSSCPASGSGNIAASVNLLNGGTATFTVNATVAGNASGSIANTATIAAPVSVTDPTPGNNSATDTDTVNLVADLSITKTDGVTSVNAGGTTTYTIIVANAGPSAANGAVFTDPAVANLNVTGVTCGSASSGAVCPTVPNTTVALMQGAGIVIPTLPSGGSVTFTVNASIAGGATGTIANTANVAAPAGVTDPTPGNNSATDTDTVNLAADLSITKTDGVTGVNAGGTTTYTIVVSNAGPSGADGAIFTDPAVANLSVTSVTCGSPTGGAACPTVPNTTVALMQGAGIVIPTLPSGGSVTFTVNATVAGGATGTIANTANVAAPAGVTDPTPGNNSATDSDTVNLVADLSITKTDGVPTVTPGTSTTYTIVVNNNGPSSVTGATVSDILPASVGSDTFTAVGSGGASGFTAGGSGNINDTVNLPVGATITYTLVANIASSATGTLVNTATVSAPGGVTDPTPGNNSATDSDTLTPQVTLAVVKTDGSASYTPGGTATYTVTITDTGASDAEDVTVTDALPAGVTLTAAVSCVANGSASCGTVTGGIGETSFGTTGASIGAGNGSSLVFTVPVAFDSGMTANPLVNTATATDLATNATASGSDSDTLAPQVTLAVVKSDGSSTYTPGGTATYTVTITDGGLSDATNVTVSDALPAGVTLTATATCVAAGSASCGSVTGLAGQTSFGTTGASIAAGAGNSLKFTAPVAFAAGMTTDPLVNTATASDVPSAANGSGSDSDARSPQVSLAVTKSDGSATYTPGGTATYTVTVANTGLTDALDVSVDDALPTGVTLTGNVTCTANGSSTCGTVTGSLGQTSFNATGATIVNGGGNSLVFTVPVAFDSDLADDPLVNAATANDLASGASGSGSDSDVRAAQAALTVTKTDGSATYKPGGTATYTIVASNAGPSDATSTTVSDPLPSGVTLSANASCVAAGTAACGTVTGTTGQTSFGTTGASIGAGAGNSLTFTAPVAFASSLTSSTLTNTVTVTDPASASPATASDSDTLNADVDLAITKTDGVTTAVPGTTTTYTIVVSNTGPSDAIGARVTDTFSAAITSASWSCVAAGGGSCTASGTGNISDTVNVPVGATLTYTVVASISVSATGTLTNTATVTAPAGATDTNPGNNSATDSDTLTAVAPVADLAITKTDGVTSVNAGGATIYTVVVSNAGPSSANGAVFTDPAVANLNATGVTCGSASGGAACPTVPNTTVALMQGAGIVIATLPSGGSVTFTVNATVASGATGTIANTANIAAPAGVTDPNPGNNSATDTDTVVVIANLALAKTDGSTTYTPGGTATYSITATNSGPSNAINVTVTDNLPSGLTLTAAPTCIATGSATCGSISGVAGGTSFTATGATIAAGAGNRLVYSLPVLFAVGLKASQITNTATASAPAAASVATASSTNTLSTTPHGQSAQPIPVGDGPVLWLLTCLILLLGGRRARARL